MTDPALPPFSPPQQIADDLFVVYGSIRANAQVRFTRNMAIVHHAGELTLINTVRMDEPGLAALDALGTVKHVLRLGPFHGMDDPFYVERYKATFWAPPGGKTFTAPAVDRQLVDGGELPFPNARAFVFEHMIEPEGALLLERSPGVLLTTDSIQSYATPPHMPHTSLVARLVMPLMGFGHRTLIGPVWLKKAVTNRDGMAQEFKRLLELDFDRLLGGHGMYLAGGAKAEVQAAVAKAFG